MSQTRGSNRKICPYRQAVKKRMDEAVEEALKDYQLPMIFTSARGIRELNRAIYQKWERDCRKSKVTYRSTKIKERFKRRKQWEKERLGRLDTKKEIDLMEKV